MIERRQPVIARALLCNKIALATGFSSHSHFTSAFHAELGVVPSSVSAPARRPVPARDT
jgi:AraC-like DNA-binding protein